MNLEKAAQALVECGYADYINPYAGNLMIWWEDRAVDDYGEVVDPINNVGQMFALVDYFQQKDGGKLWVDAWLKLPVDMLMRERLAACLEEILK